MSTPGFDLVSCLGLSGGGGLRPVKVAFALLIFTHVFFAIIVLIALLLWYIITLKQVFNFLKIITFMYVVIVHFLA
jgi:hypothetical protein